MSTQRRVVRWQRFQNTRLAGAGNPPSHDAAVFGPEEQFRRVAFGLTASASTFWRIELATNSLSFNSCCEWRFCHWNSSRTASLDFSPPIRSFRAGAASARTVQSALPQVPTGVCRGTERQHGQGNLYLQHAARNAACDSGRRSARGDLLRA